MVHLSLIKFELSYCWAEVRSSLVSGKRCEVYCWEAEVNVSLMESKDTSKIKILVVVSLCFVPWIGRSKSSKLYYCRKLPASVSCCIVEVVGTRSNFWRLTWCEGKVWSWSRVKSLKFLLDFPLEGGFCLGMCLHLVSIVLCTTAFGNFLMN